MAKKVFYCLLVLTFILVFTIPSTFAATLQITGAKTDTMSSFDTDIPNSSNADIPSSNSPFWPAYHKPNTYIFLQVTSNGIKYPFYVMEANSVIKYTIDSTSYTGNGQVDTIKLLVKDLSISSAPGENRQWTNYIHIKSYTPATGKDITSNNVSLRWYMN